MPTTKRTGNCRKSPKQISAAEIISRVLIETDVVIMCIKTFLLSTIFVVSFFQAMPGWAQTPDVSQPSRYFLGEEQQMLLPVNIFGLVKKPGQYMVPYRTDLISLVAFAGGFAEGARINNVKIVRRSQANNGGSKPQVIKINVKDFFETGNGNLIPQLMPDDTIIVSGTAGRAINKIFGFFRAILPLAQLYFIIDRTSRD